MGGSPSRDAGNSADLGGTSNDAGTGPQTSKDGGTGGIVGRPYQVGGTTAAGDKNTEDSGTDARVVDDFTVTMDASPDLVGYPTKLNAVVSTILSSSDVNYLWEIAQVPAGSQISSGFLESRTAPSVSFEPDMGGEYTIKLTVSRGSESVSVVKTIVVPTIAIGYVTVSGNQNSYTRAGAMVQSDGTNAHEVGCFFSSVANSEQEWLTNFRSEGQFNTRAYYPEDVAVPTILAFAYASASSGDMRLQIAGTNSDCSPNPPRDTAGGYSPKFSPDGSRVSFMLPTAVNSNSVYSLRTIGVDGSDLHVIRPDVALGVGVPIGAEWTGVDQIVWIDTETSADGASSWNVVYQASDLDGAFGNKLATSTVMSCAGAKNAFSGLVHAAIRDGIMFLTEVTPAVTNLYKLWRLELVNGEYLCDTTAPSNQAISTNQAHDFELSPDGSRILFFQSVAGAATETDSDATDLLIGPSSGNGPFTTLISSQGTANVGAHWVAGGRQIVWTRTSFDLAQPADSGTSTYNRPRESAVWISNSDGTHARQLQHTQLTSSDVRMLHTGASGCSMPLRVTSRTRSLWFIVSLLAWAAGTRRRRSVTNTTIERQPS